MELLLPFDAEYMNSLDNIIIICKKLSKLVYKTINQSKDDRRSIKKVLEQVGVVHNHSIYS